MWGVEALPREGEGLWCAVWLDQYGELVVIKARVGYLRQLILSELLLPGSDGGDLRGGQGAE